MSKHASYRVLRQTDKVILIADVGNHSTQRTITNDAEFVYEEVSIIYGLVDRDLIYMDSMGNYTKLTVVNGVAQFEMIPGHKADQLFYTPR